MAIEYTEEKRFTVEQVEALFKSVGWGIGAVARTVVQGIAAFGYGNQRMGWRLFGRLGSRARRYGRGRKWRSVLIGGTYVVIDGYPVVMFTIRPLVHTVKITAGVRRGCAMTRDHE